MNQISPFSEPENRRQICHKIFLAVKPPRSVAEKIGETALGLKKWYQLPGKLRPIELLHVTICEIGDFLELDEKIVALARQAGEAVAAGIPSFDFEVNQAVCFGHGARNVPFVLARKERCEPMDLLYQKTFLQLRAQGLQIRKRSFNPHVTVSYTHGRIPTESIDRLGWQVEELVLIDSHVGLTKYTELGRWKLGAQEA